MDRHFALRSHPFRCLDKELWATAQGSLQESGAMGLAPKPLGGVGCGEVAQAFA